MITFEDFMKAVEIVKQYQFQVEEEYQRNNSEFKKIPLVLNPKQKVKNLNISIQLCHLVNKLEYDLSIEEISKIPERELLMVAGFGKKGLLDLRRVKLLAGFTPENFRIM